MRALPSLNGRCALPSLETLDLYCNELAELPAAVSQLTSLSELRLDGNR